MFGEQAGGQRAGFGVVEAVRDGQDVPVVGRHVLGEARGGGAHHAPAHGGDVVADGGDLSRELVARVVLLAAAARGGVGSFQHGGVAVVENNGVEMPALGLGVFQTPPDETRAAVTAALDLGYRHIDTAAAYGNEREVGQAIRASAVPRDDIFIETKIWVSDYGYDETLHGFDKSAAKLGVDQIDLLILHQALPSDFDKTLAAYRALEQLLADGKVRAIGVSNFMVDHVTALLDATSVVPAVNQLEIHPYFQQRAVLDFDDDHGILNQAWSPIGGITFYPGYGEDRRSVLEDPAVTAIAEAHGKSPAQVLLRWGIQHGRSVIPKSTKRHRIAENIDVFDFALTTNELKSLDALETGRRGGPEPSDVTLAAYGRAIPEA